MAKQPRIKLSGKEVIKDIYIQNFVKYETFIKFNENPEAKQHQSGMACRTA